MIEPSFELYDGSQVTESMLQEASRLFSEHYGVWHDEAAQYVGSFAKAGNHVRISKSKLRSEHLPEGGRCSYARVAVDGRLVGNAWACRWLCNEKTVSWVTQLVVHRDHRKQGLATGLLNLLRHHDDDVYGILSSNPAACLAAATAFGRRPIHTVPLDFIKENTEEIIKASPVRYVKDAKLCGTLFDSKDTRGRVSCADTNFWIDHTEPTKTLAEIRKMEGWPLGDLHDGHEFLLLLEVKDHANFRSEKE